MNIYKSAFYTYDASTIAIIKLFIKQSLGLYLAT